MLLLTLYIYRLCNQSKSIKVFRILQVYMQYNPLYFLIKFLDHLQSMNTEGVRF